MTPSESALKLIEELELKNLAPLPLNKVLAHLEYKAQLFQPNEKTRNLACGVNQKEKVVMANSADSPAEQRYAFAHAIAHAVLHPGENMVDRKNNLHHTNEDPKESEANQFADELVMENGVFLTKWDELNGDLNRLGSAFGVTKERITARASKLGII